MRPLHAVGLFLVVSVLNGAMVTLLATSDTRPEWALALAMFAFAVLVVGGALRSTGRVSWQGAFDRTIPTVVVVLLSTLCLGVALGSSLFLFDASSSTSPVWIGYALLLPSALAPVVGMGLGTWQQERLASLAYRPKAVAAALLGFALGVAATHLGAAMIHHVVDGIATRPPFFAAMVAPVLGALLTLPWFLSAWAHHAAMGPASAPTPSS